jgi:hypothetical protein
MKIHRWPVAASVDVQRGISLVEKKSHMIKYSYSYPAFQITIENNKWPVAARVDVQSGISLVE